MSSPSPKYFKAWIIFFLIATVGGTIIGGIIGAILGVSMKLAGAELTTIKWTARITGFLIAAPISWFTFRWVVEEFLVKGLTQPPSPAPPAEPPHIAK